MKISVIGLGKLGAPLALLLASKNHAVIGIDFNESIVEKLNLRQAPFYEPRLQELLDDSSTSFIAQSHFTDAISTTDATFIIVPTPSEAHGQFTNRYILSAIQSMGDELKKKNGYHLIVITSTVMPGSTDGEIKEALEQASGKVVGKDLGLCYNPEFIALGSVVSDMLCPDMVLIGESDKKAGDLLESIYKGFCENHPPIQRMNNVNAEITKLSLNTYVTTKISYGNMLGELCEALPGSDAHVVTNAIGLDSRIGRKYLQAAVPFGGPCFPRDNVAFRSMAQELGVSAYLAEATQSTNDAQPKRLQALVEKHGSGPRIGILGLSYKPGSYVIEESPGIKVANRLKQEGYSVTVYDPMAIDEAKKELVDGVMYASSVLDCTQNCDTLLIMTKWPEFYEELTPEAIASSNCCKVIIDCWHTLDQQAFDSTQCKLIYVGEGVNLSKNEKLQMV